MKLTTKEAVGNVAVSMATSGEERAKMARYADVHGLQAAAKHFSAKLGRNIPYTTIQSKKKSRRQNLGSD